MREACWHMFMFGRRNNKREMLGTSLIGMLSGGQQRVGQLATRAYQSTSAASTNYKDKVVQAKSSARRLVLLENVTTRKDVNNLLSKHYLDQDYLSDRLGVQVIDHWTWFYRRRNFMLVQLSGNDQIAQLQSKAGYQSHSFPLRTRMIQTIVDFPESALRDREDDREQHCHQQMLITELRQPLNCNRIRKQVRPHEFDAYLDSSNYLSPLDYRLRYFLLTELEDHLCGGVFDGFQVYPFGSSLAGLGDSSSDLDLVLLHRGLQRSAKMIYAHPEIRSERDQAQLALSLFADAFKNFIPNFSSINRILRARVPIVKVSFDLAPIDIDVSIELSEENGHHGFIMASYIHYAVSVNKQVRQLFTFLKLWARQHGLVKSIAGNWFTNFQIITLAMFFLQTKQILKPIDSYQAVSSEIDPCKNIKLDQLVLDFFEFVVSFNFEKDGISIFQGRIVSKPDFSPIYLENPIERELNICKNVNGTEFKKFLLASYNTLDAMHTVPADKFHLVDLLDPEHLRRIETSNIQQQN